MAVEQAINLPGVDLTPILDPRPELGGSDLWFRILALAYLGHGHEVAGAYQLLHGLRCMGVAARVGPERLILDRGAMDLEDWRRAKWLLGEERSAVEGILTEARKGLN